MSKKMGTVTNNTDFDIKNFGKIIKSYRKTNQMTQSEVAQMVGLTPPHYSRLENGKFFPGLQTFFRLVKVLQINLSDFELYIGEQCEPVSYEIMHIINAYNKDQKRAVLAFLKTMSTV